MGMMMRRFRFDFRACSERWTVMVMVVLLGMMMMIPAQCWAEQGSSSSSSSVTSCVNQLIPCFNFLYLNGSHDNPPDSCCNPLKSVIKSNPECLCSMISINVTNQTAAAQQYYGINLTQAQQLPGRCGHHVDPIACLTGSPNSKNWVTNSASSSSLISIWSQSIVPMAAVALYMIFHAVMSWR